MLCAYIKNSSFCLRAKNYLADEVCVSDTKCKWRSSRWFRRWANSILLFGGKGENAYKCLLGFPRRHLLFWGEKALKQRRGLSEWNWSIQINLKRSLDLRMEKSLSLHMTKTRFPLSAIWQRNTTSLVPIAMSSAKVVESLATVRVV